MKKYTIILLLALMSSCASIRNIEKVAYMQNVEIGEVVTISPVVPITLKPKDKISIIVYDKNPELSNMFNMYRVQSLVGSEQTVSTLNSSNREILGYVIDDNGYIDFPILGSLKVAGLTRIEVEQFVKQKLMDGSYISNPNVNAQFLNLNYTMLGEVRSPGEYDILKDKTTIFDAVGRAGDLTIYGRRDRVLLTRTSDGTQITYQLDLRDADIVNSPAYYVMQNDIIYVEPNIVKANQTSITGNSFRSTSFWISIASILTSIASLLIYSL